MRRLPKVTDQQAEEMFAEGFLTDAGIRAWRICRRFQSLKTEGKRSGEAIVILMSEFNLSDKRIEEIIYHRTT